ALDSVLALAGDVGLVALIHNDMDVPFATAPATPPPAPAKCDACAEVVARPAYLEEMKALIRRHPSTTIIWAHTGLGRVVRPVHGHAAIVASMLADPAFANLYFDISWDVVAKYLVASPEAIKISADLINRFPDRFLFGTDAVAPTSASAYLVT